MRLWSGHSPSPVRRLTLVTSQTASLAQNGIDRSLSITRDGSRIVYVGGTGQSKLFVRALDSLDPIQVSGAGAPRHPFLSPDGKWIGFFDGGPALKKVPITGGTVTMIAQTSSGPGQLRTRDVRSESQVGLGICGATWLENDEIVLTGMDGGLLRVPAAGGIPELLAQPDPASGEGAYCWPESIPGRNALLYTSIPKGDWSEKGSKAAIDNANIAVLDLRTGKRQLVLDGGSDAHYLESGFLVYVADGALKVVPFDVRTLAVAGITQVVVPHLSVSSRGAADFDVAVDGTLAYVPGTAGNDLVSLLWVNRSGIEEPIRAQSFVFRYPRISPDGKRVAVGTTRDLAICDFSSGTLSWLGVGPASYPVWAANGQKLIFSSTRRGVITMESQSLDAPGSIEKLAEGPQNRYPNAISPDGRYLLFREDGTSADLMWLDLTQNTVRPLVQTPYRELNAEFSPDGSFVAYQSNESGEDEVYVQPFPNAGGKRWTVSSGGGSQPAWSYDGQELFFVAPPNTIMTVRVELDGGRFVASAASKLFEGPYYFGGGVISGRTYDVSRDGKRFLVMKSVGDSAFARSNSIIEVVLNWQEELKQRFTLR
jgi:serine/threonine-protein kinase